MISPRAGQGRKYAVLYPEQLPFALSGAASVPPKAGALDASP